MIEEIAYARGLYSVKCYNSDSELKWAETFSNVVTTAGKNLALDSYLSSGGGSAPGGTGPYMSLINGSAFSAVAAADTMTSHSGWTEFTSYNGARQLCVFNSASAGQKALSTALQFTINAAGPLTVQGAFIVYGPGASTTLGNTSGTLYSAGAFAGGAQTVNLSDSLFIAYVASL